MTDSITGVLRATPPGGYLISTIRAVLLCAALLGLDYLLDFGVAPFFLIIACLGGIWVGGGLVLTRLKFPGVLLLHLGAWLICWLLGALLIRLPLSGESLLLLDHGVGVFHTLLVISLITSVSTWSFWKLPLIGTLEVLCISIASLQAFAAHRNYRFDAAKTLNELSWIFQVHPLVTLVALGFLLTLLIGFYFSVTTRAATQDARLVSVPTFQSSGEQSLPSVFIGSALLTALLLLVTYYVFQQNYVELNSRLANGVSDELKEGLSPLGFHSALGASSQPAALVRLENDYPDNPHSPMLYLREAALSKFNGKEMVLAADEFNPDVPIQRPGTPFKSDGFPEQYQRTPINQTVYLLTDHKLTFAIDYPLSIVGLTLPKSTNKFKKAYKAYSMAPAFTMSELFAQNVGNPEWDEATLAHFTEQHEDKRYREKALSIIGSQGNPILQAHAIVQFLNKNAIYTLTPGHEVADNEDATAPFLFEDMRGYCVHFAHASVYMLRGLGIPARIGTGYLTDLSQAKDGHILLRMSDRHAWAEIYVAGYGWIPFDTQPEQVEIHAETPVDSNLLEELMGLLEPGEEILPEDILDDEAFDELEESMVLFDVNDLLSVLLLSLSALILAKVYYVYGWKLPGAPSSLIDRGWTAFCIRLADLGIRRETGETTLEFSDRVARTLSNQVDTLPPLLITSKYAGTLPDSIDSVRDAITKDLRVLTRFPLWQRVLSFFNPFSLFLRIQAR